MCGVKLAVTLMLVGVLGACTGPGSPTLREDTSDGYGPLIPECRNVSPAAIVRAYDTAFYHSTWGSVGIEALQSGTRSDLNIDQETNGFVRFKKEFAYAVMLQMFGLDGRDYPFEPFCMKYNAPLSNVAHAVNSILPALDNSIVKSNEEFGLFGTDFFNREHMRAKWRDRYIITLRETTEDQTVVTVLRELHISRGKEGFAIAQSDGHNEAWILKKIAAKAK